MTRPTFAPPAAWLDFIAEVELRTGQAASRIGYWSLCANWMTGAEQSRAARTLRAYQDIADANPAGLDVDLHGWASVRLADTREGMWWRCRREGCLADLERRRKARRRADHWTRIAEETAA